MKKLDSATNCRDAFGASTKKTMSARHFGTIPNSAIKTWWSIVIHQSFFKILTMGIFRSELMTHFLKTFF
jgi:hypothetical protein